MGEMTTANTKTIGERSHSEDATLAVVEEFLEPRILS
jgi:hypothetical protein